MAGDTETNYDKFFIDADDVELITIMKMGIE